MANENSWKYQFTNDTNHQRFPKDFKSSSSSSSSTRRESYESMENGTHKMAHSHHASLNVNESSFTILTQVIGPLLIAGLGMVLAGLLLDHIQDTPVFRYVSEIFILVPALLGLKGNLEMTMASRLSSIANMGLLKSYQQRYEIFKANIALTQCQSVVVGFCAALFASIINLLNTGSFHWTNTLMLCATSILTAAFASLILGSIMMLIIVWSLDHSVNPDNIATPIAAALGDLITLYILSFISDLLYSSIDYFPLLCIGTIVSSLLLTPILWRIADRNLHTKVALVEGWTPVILAMTISSFGGCILNFAVARFKGIAVYQPLINGVGGNLAAIQASRMSTFLHTFAQSEKSKPKSIFRNLSPLSFLFRIDIHSRTARLLLGLVMPCQLVFLTALSLLHNSDISLNFAFVVAYLIASLLQVFILLYLAEIIINLMWSKGIDPDNSSIPYLTAFGDLFGTLFLYVAFSTLNTFQLAEMS